MSRLFDPVALANATLAANATRRTALPPGDIIAQVTKLDFKSGKAGPNAQNPGAPWTRADWTMEITDPDYLSLCAGEPKKVVTNLGIMLDIDDNGAIATGENRNVRLGKFRDACGANGMPLSACVGQMVRIQIAQKPHPTEPGTVLDEVVAYTKA